MLIVKMCANAMFIFRLMNMYSAGAVGIRGTIERLELANAKLFDLAVLARACGSWYVGLEQLAVLALNLELKKRVQVFGENPARENTGKYQYFSGGLYPIGRDIAFVERSGSKKVTGKLKNCSSRSLKTSAFIGRQATRQEECP